jgi:DNA-binding transcriptional regulator YhcF (GntR family)
MQRLYTKKVYMLAAPGGADWYSDGHCGMHETGRPTASIMTITDTEEKPSTRSSAWIADDIAAAIAARKLPPGTKLREEALSRVYSVSRTKIRAALLILSKDKLINIVPDKGAFVSQPSEAEARDVFATRRIIEAALVAQFIDKARPADYARLEKHIRNERAAVARPDSKARSQLLGDFHVLLAAGGGQPGADRDRAGTGGAQFAHHHAVPVGAGCRLFIRRACGLFAGGQGRRCAAGGSADAGASQSCGISAALRWRRAGAGGSGCRPAVLSR